MKPSVVLGAALVSLAATDTSIAQRQEAARPQRQEAARPQQRGQLEAELRRGFARAVRARVGLSEAQMQQLAPITQRHAVQRARLQRDERATRQELQRLLRDTVPADSAKVGGLLARLVEAQKQRALLLEMEQKDLATIMSPVQRARFMALQEQLRRQMEQRRRGQPDDLGPPPRRGRPPL